MIDRVFNNMIDRVLNNMIDRVLNKCKGKVNIFSKIVKVPECVDANLFT